MGVHPQTLPGKRHLMRAFSKKNLKKVIAKGLFHFFG